MSNQKKDGAVTPHFHIWVICYLITAVIILADHAVKHIVFSNMETGETIPLLEDIFHITYVQNRGAAFSMWQQQWVILIAIPALVLVAGLVLIYVKRHSWSGMSLVSVALICGGGLGNLIDRMTRGYVVDMFDCRFFPFFDFPVFNVADIAICVGCGMLLLDVIFLEGRRDAK